MGLAPPALVLAADHRARGVLTMERYRDYLAVLEAAMAHCDGVLASAQPLEDLAAAGALTPDKRTYLSVNRTGLAGSAFELDDRLVASVARAAGDGWTGIKHMTRVDLSDERTAGALELLGRLLEESRAAGLEAMVECVPWAEGRMARDTDSVVLAAVVAHDLGSPLLKVPVPHSQPGDERRGAVSRVVGAVGVPVLFLGGPLSGRGGPEESRAELLEEVADVMAGGGAGMALGRRLYLDPEPGELARLVSDAVHRR